MKPEVLFSNEAVCCGLTTIWLELYTCNWCWNSLLFLVTLSSWKTFCLYIWQHTNLDTVLFILVSLIFGQFLCFLHPVSNCPAVLACHLLGQWVTFYTSSVEWGCVPKTWKGQSLKLVPCWSRKKRWWSVFLRMVLVLCFVPALSWNFYSVWEWQSPTT